MSTVVLTAELARLPLLDELLLQSRREKEKAEKEPNQVSEKRFPLCGWLKW